MRTLVGLALTACLCTASAPAAGAESLSRPQSSPSGNALTAPPSRLLATALREGQRFGRQVERKDRPPAAKQSSSRSWISRHPTLFGALVGAGGGVIAAGTMENELFCSGGDEDCFFHGPSRLLVGAGMGAGVGALIGLIGGR